MKYASTYYQSRNVATCEIAGAVALCAVEDLRVNFFRFGGFPQIIVEAATEGFKVTISATDEPVREASFMLAEEEAFKAATRFKKKASSYDADIFDRVQDALAKVVG